VYADITDNTKAGESSSEGSRPCVGDASRNLCDAHQNEVRLDSDCGGSWHLRTI
jgi:hypothetical protein